MSLPCQLPSLPGPGAPALLDAAFPSSATAEPPDGDYEHCATHGFSTSCSLGSTITESASDVSSSSGNLHEGFRRVSSLKRLMALAVPEGGAHAAGSARLDRPRCCGASPTLGPASPKPAFVRMQTPPLWKHSPGRSQSPRAQSLVGDSWSPRRTLEPARSNSSSCAAREASAHEASAARKKSRLLVFHSTRPQTVRDPRAALEGKGPQRGPQRRLDRRLEEFAKVVGGGYCWLQMPLQLALGVRRTVAGRRLGALGGGGGSSPPSNASLRDPQRNMLKAKG